MSYSNGSVPDVMVTQGLGDVEVEVLENQTVVKDGNDYKTGDTFVCHASEAMQLAARGHVEIKGAV